MSDFSPAHRPPDAVGSHRYIHVIGTSVFVSDRIELDIRGDEAPLYFLGMHGGEAVWAVDVPRGEDPSFGAALDLYSFYGRASELEWAIAGRAVQVAEWARTHRFCGRCGTPTEPSENDRSMRCPACGLLAYPRLAPAMITLVTRGEPGPDQEALLARGVQFRAPMYSCVAGFVEPGESLEQSVIREVREEVGIEVVNPRYWGSQPWPFPHSLMIGFTAEWASGEIACDPSEIVDAQWYRKDDLPPIPPRISIARKLIDAWLADSTVHQADQAARASTRIDELLHALRPRPGAEPVGGSVHLHCTDVAGEWLLVPHASNAGFDVTREHAKGSCALRGTASDLLAVLRRERSIDEIDVVGDADVARRFVAWAERS